jgi:hypothetical protein
VNRFNTKADHDHRDRMDRCQELEPCSKIHGHGPGCYRAATIYAVVQEVIARSKLGRPS